MHPANSIGSVLKSARSPLGACLLLLCILCGMQPVAGQGTQPTRSFYHVDNGVTYAVFVYETPGSFTFTPPAGVTSVDYLIVGGGGGGAGQGNSANHYNPGGGGAGGLLQGTFATTNSLFTIVVGSGGLGAGSPNVAGGSGTNSSAFGFTALGGGGGGGGVGLAGGSGGGGGYETAAGGLGTVGQGTNGGVSFGGGSNQRSGGGGGGAGQAGTDGVNSVGGKGGNGLDFSTMFSTEVGANGWFAGGGGGSAQSNLPGSGGTGGGGNGASGGPGGIGLPGTGSGGGGASSISGGCCSNAFGGAGGSGVVIVRYAASPGSPDPALSTLSVIPRFGALANNSDEAQVLVTLRDATGAKIPTPQDVFITTNLGGLTEFASSGSNNSFIYTADGTNGIAGRTYRVEVFSTVGTRNVTINKPTEVEYLIIGGGGSGGPSTHGPGGGAGGYRSSVVGEMSGGGGSAEPTLTLNQGTYQVTVGAGGIGGTNNGDGSNSSFSNIVALGGGGGNGRNGGSGSGTIYGNASVGLGTVNQGFSGGTGVMSSAPPHYGSGGGGGAGGAGDTGTNVSGGNGGLGLSSTITGVPLTRAGGGGGSTYNGGTPGTGSAGGGNGSSGQGTAAAPNSGSGGGGSERFGGGQGGAGGSGIVILRYEVATGTSLVGQSFTLKTPTAGRATIAAYLGTDATGTLIGTALVDFIDPAKYLGGTGRGDVASAQTSLEALVATGPPVAAQAILTATPSLGLVANNTDEAQVRVILRDANGVQITNSQQDVFLSSTLGTISAVQFTTGAYDRYVYVADGTNGTAGQTYMVHVFKQPGSNVFEPLVPLDVDYLIVGGGGGGGGWGGGGGAGGVLSGTASISPGSYPIAIGGGGTRGTGAYTGGGDGGSSTALGFTALGGGGGGWYNTNPGRPGGSGGGGGGGESNSIANGASGGAGTAGQGFAGGFGGLRPSGLYRGGGGGGGAGAAAANFNGELGGQGGDGIASKITGIERFYGGGGGGHSPGQNTAGFASGGLGGGGRGGRNYGLGEPAADGQANTGGGGGGATGIAGLETGAGGSGILVLRHLYNPNAFSPTPSAAYNYLLRTPTAGRATITAYLGTDANGTFIGTAQVDFIDPNKYRGGTGRGDVASVQTSPEALVETGPPVTAQAIFTATPRFGLVANNTDSAQIRLILRDANGVQITNSQQDVFVTTNLGTLFENAGIDQYTYIADGTNGIAGQTYVVQLFKNPGNHTFQVSNTIQNFDYLVVAGGGGGGSDMGGGGGAGGVLQFTNQTLSPGNYSITVGAGGAGALAGVAQARGTNGSNSVFGTHTAIGGGGGASNHDRSTNPAGNGGSGGGASGGAQSPGGGSAGVGGYGGGARGLGTPGQGFDGSWGIYAWYPGGGGGAGEAGSTNPAKGGNGILSNILGSPSYWGGGGGGSGYSGVGGNGGLGGGGGGAVGSTTGGAGLNNGLPGGGGVINSQTNTPGGNGGLNTGGGGGGGAHYSASNKGGDGGSGIVVIRYPLTGTLSDRLTAGVYSATLKTPTAGQATITAYLGTDANGTLISSALVDFIDPTKYRGGTGRGDVVSAQTSPEALVETGIPVVAQAILTATPRFGVVANNTDEAQVQVILRDANGIQITGTQHDVFLSTDLGSLTSSGVIGGDSTYTYVGDGTNGTLGETYAVHVFRNPGSQLLQTVSSLNVDYLLVAGGGGGGSDMGGGGGSGGVLQGSTVLNPNRYNLFVGGGGPGAVGYNNTPPPGANGGNSTAFGFTAIGGGGGSSGHWQSGAYAGPPPTSGGSGGGASARYENGTMPGAAGTPGQGTSGGSGIYSGDYYSGGGGGAGSNSEVNAINATRAGNGGNGVSSVIIGTSFFFGGGGGGAGHTGGPAGNGGQGGGGGGSRWTGGVVGTGGTGGLNNGTNGANAGSKGGNGGRNTGSGGGGGSHQGPGGDGGAGILIIRYKLSEAGITTGLTTAMQLLNGEYRSTLKTSIAGQATIRAYLGTSTSDPEIGTALIDFIDPVKYRGGTGRGDVASAQTSPEALVETGLPVASQSSVEATPRYGLVANNSDEAQVRVILRDASGTQITAIPHDVFLSTSLGTLSTTQFTNGVYLSSLKTSIAGQATIKAYLGTSAGDPQIGTALIDFIDPVKYRGGTGRGDVASAQTSPEALVETGIPVAAQAILTATPRFGLVANNTDEAQVRLILRDANGIQITGTQHDVFLSTDLGTLTSSGVIGGDSTYTYVGNGTNGTLGETYAVHVFRNPGSQLLLTVSSLNVDYLLVAGGGGGGSDMGGGGGSGGVLQGSTVLNPNQYNLFVGGGGPGAVGYNNTPPPGANGSNSTAFGFTAIGGGGGSSGHLTAAPTAGPPPTTGGSGGGSAARYIISGAGQSFGAAGTPGQGTRGGNSPTVNNDYYAGGGGGAGSNTEVDAVNGTRAGNGGNGVSSVIMGTAYFFGGGGGGAGHTGGPAGNGGQGGGGGGSRWTGGVVGTGGTGGLNNGTNGANAYSKGGNGGRNTGSGGGGGSHQGPGGDGGSGILIIRYKLSEAGITTGLTTAMQLLNGEYRSTLKTSIAGQATIKAYLGTSASGDSIGTAFIDFIDITKYRGGIGRGDSRQAPATAFNMVPDMGLTVNTQAHGTSPDRMVALPLRGNTNVLIEWGDGNTTSVTNANQTTDVLHTYAADGIYPISISGLLSQFGTGTGSGYAHADKIVAVNSIVSRDLSSLSGAFNGAVNLTEVPSYLMPNITNLSAAFKGATAFDQDISGWNITSVTNMADMFLGVTLSPEVYSSILTGWGAQVVQANVSFHGGNSKYFLGAAMLGRKKLTDPVGSSGYDWTITDGGPILPEESIWFVPETGLVNKGFATGLSLKYNSGQEYLYNGEITISLASGSGTLSGGVIASSTGGQFAFRELLLDAAGVFTFQASIAYHHNVPQTYTTTVSSAITIVQSAFFGGQGRGEALAESPMINLEGKRRLTIEGTFTAANKIFDGTRAATILTNNLSLAGIIAPDAVVGTFTALFNSPAIGINKLVRPLVSLSGADTANYFVSYLNAPTTTASIFGAHYFGGNGKGDDMDFSSLSTLNGDRFFSWIGGFAGDTKNWFNPGNWSPPALPASTDFVQIESTAHQPMISGSSPGQDLERTGLTTISNGATLTLTPGPVLTFTSAAEFNTEGTGRIILEPGALYVNESASEPTLEVQQVITGQKGWRMLGSPLKGITYSNLLTGLAPQGMGGLSSPFTSLQPNVLWFDETDGGTTLQSWRKPTNVGNTVSLGRGHYVYVFNGASIPGGLGTYGDPLPVTLRATGKEHNFLNSGAVNFGITYTPRTTPLIQPDLEEELYIETNPADAGFNMVTNPTASVIDFYQADAWTKTNLDNSIYVWDPSMNSHAGSWRIFNGTTGNLDNGRIAPYQAFWVRTNAASPVLSLNSSQAKTLLPKSYYSRMVEEVKSAKNAEILTLPFHVKGEGMMAESWLSFDPNGKPGQDPRDAYQLESLSDDWLLLYTYGSQNHRTPLQINNQDYLSGEEKSIPLMLAAAKSEKEFSGSYTLSWKVPTDWPQGVSLTLMDHTKERAVDMLDQESYGFVFEAPKLPGARVNLLRSGMKSPGPVIFDSPFDSGDPSARTSRPDLSKRPFTIRIGSYVPGKGLDYLPDFPKLYPPIPNSFSREVKIRFYIPYAMTAQVRITDVTGRVVQDFGVGDYAGGTYELEFVDEADRLASGFYMVQLLTRDHLLNQKLIKLN